MWLGVRSISNSVCVCGGGGCPWGGGEGGLFNLGNVSNLTIFLCAWLFEEKKKLDDFASVL